MYDVLRPLVAVALLAASFHAPVVAQEAAAEEPDTVSFGIDLTAEYDDNPNLGADTGDPLEESREDFVVKAVPRFRAELPYEDHRFRLDLAGIFREGSDTPPSEYNLRGKASADLKFASGLEIEIFDFYLHTRFDQALFFVELPDLDLAEPGISESEGNAIGVDLSYTPKRRLRFDGRFVSSDTRFQFGTDEPPDDRESEVYSAAVEIPLSLEWVGYLAADGEDQASDLQAARNFDQQRYVAGLRWEHERIVLYAEAGSGEADFDDGPGVEFDETVWVIGSEIDVSDETRLEASFGRNLYGETTYELVLQRAASAGSGLRLMVRKSTENSFAPETVGRIFDATVVGVRWDQPLGDQLRLAAEARYFALESADGDLSQEDDTTLGRLELNWVAGPEWLRLGGYAQISERSSNLPQNEFDNTRVGVTVTFAKGSI